MLLILLPEQPGHPLRLPQELSGLGHRRNVGELPERLQAKRRGAIVTVCDLDLDVLAEGDGAGMGDLLAQADGVPGGEDGEQGADGVVVNGTKIGSPSGLPNHPMGSL